MASPPALAPSRLLQNCDPAQFEFQTTAELQGLDGLIGQARATDAVRFGVGIRQEGFNLFVLGPAGMGKRSLVRQLLAERAPDENGRADRCYLNHYT